MRTVAAVEIAVACAAVHHRGGDTRKEGAVLQRGCAVNADLYAAVPSRRRVSAELVPAAVAAHPCAGLPARTQRTHAPMEIVVLAAPRAHLGNRHIHEDIGGLQRRTLRLLIRY